MMTQWFSSLRPVARLSLVILIACLGGGVATFLQLPLGWLLGALFSTAILALCGMTAALPKSSRQGGQTIAGFAVGLYFTPEVGAVVLQLSGWIIMACALSLAISLGCGLLLTRHGGCDRTTAFFSTLPGGMAEMAVLAQKFGAHPAPVALAQTLRVVMVVLILPTLTSAFTYAMPGTAEEVTAIANMPLLLGVASSVAMALALRALRIFNPWLIGGLAGGIFTALVVGQAARAPWELVAIAQIAIGASLGVRFERSLMLSSCRGAFLPAVLATIALSIAAHALIAWGLSAIISFPTALLATAPAGIAEMSLTAQMLALTPPLVVAWQLCRIIAIAVMTAPLFSVMQRFSPGSSTS